MQKLETMPAAELSPQEKKEQKNLEKKIRDIQKQNADLDAKYHKTSEKSSDTCKNKMQISVIILLKMQISVTKCRYLQNSKEI
jgi:phage-related minor tail protein